MKQKRGREEACDICHHYHDYEGGEPCSICGHKLFNDNEVSPLPSTLPTELIPGFLFVGSYDHASRAELLRTLGIQYILNTVPTSTNLYKNAFHYHTVTTTPPPLEECYAFLDMVRQLQGKVLLHCMSGTSRSPSIAIYFIMRCYQKHLDEAYSIVKAKRPMIAISAVDAGRLENAEVELFGDNAVRSFRVPIGKASSVGNSIHSGGVLLGS